ncbi:B-box zinc finger protein 22-like [Salvia divinorum]|uniref:B-box zinc finger protein 22-like n=1 Tax=Salvia divinorum TaxID=28513 RepID=A0ABD1GZX6_SALDI
MAKSSLSDEALLMIIMDIIRLHQLRIVGILHKRCLNNGEEGQNPPTKRRKFRRIVRIPAQETVGYFFCLEDRALLCRKCDVSIHSANSLVSGHQRFLLTGVKVGLEATEGHAEPSLGKTNMADKISEHSLPKKATPASPTAQYGKSMPVQAIGCGDFSKPPFSGGSSTGSISQWQFDEFLGYGDFTQSYNFMDNDSSKADSGKLGSSDSSQILLAADGELECDDCMGQVPETYWAVPQIISAHSIRALLAEKFPESARLCCVCARHKFPPLQNLRNQQDHSHATNSKRRRHY